MTVTRLSADATHGSERTVVALGDSITYGWGLSPELSYPAQLDRLLNENGTGPRRWRVINAGVPGDTVLCAERRYRRDAAAWRAEILIISLGLNDAALRRTRVDEQRERLWLAYRNPWVRWGLRLDMVRTRLGVSKMRPAGIEATARSQAEEHRAEPRVSPGFFARALEALARRARARGSIVYLISLPPLAWERIAADQVACYRRYDGLIRQTARSSGVQYIDVAGAPQVGQDIGYWQEDGIHLSAEGQAWLAQCIEDRLRLDGRLC